MSTCTYYAILAPSPSFYTPLADPSSPTVLSKMYLHPGVGYAGPYPHCSRQREVCSVIECFLTNVQYERSPDVVGLADARRPTIQHVRG